MSLQWLPRGCCAGYPRWQRCKTGKIVVSDCCREGGGGSNGGGPRIQLRGLDTVQLNGSLVVLYAPAGNSCLLRLSSGMEEMVWEQYSVTLQRVSSSTTPGLQLPLL
ncbi:hypothetical protein OYC64_002163 [Pagothenia borchgrevinki]|uniref:Uncharacterized protein n=1 Tax=Pagothenia borchgrevinki TaxID=8213 RepID=A0ABD2H7J0_PAGBO